MGTRNPVPGTHPGTRSGPGPGMGTRNPVPGTHPGTPSRTGPGWGSGWVPKLGSETTPKPPWEGGCVLIVILGGPESEFRTRNCSVLRHFLVTLFDPSLGSVSGSVSSPNRGRKLGRNSTPNLPPNPPRNPLPGGGSGGGFGVGLGAGRNRFRNLVPGTHPGCVPDGCPEPGSGTRCGTWFRVPIRDASRMGVRNQVPHQVAKPGSGYPSGMRPGWVSGTRSGTRFRDLVPGPLPDRVREGVRNQVPEPGSNLGIPGWVSRDAWVGVRGAGWASRHRRSHPRAIPGGRFGVPIPGWSGWLPEPPPEPPPGRGFRRGFREPVPGWFREIGRAHV